MTRHNHPGRQLGAHARAVLTHLHVHGASTLKVLLDLLAQPRHSAGSRPPDLSEKARRATLNNLETSGYLERKHVNGTVMRRLTPLGLRAVEALQADQMREAPGLPSTVESAVSTHTPQRPSEPVAEFGDLAAYAARRRVRYGAGYVCLPAAARSVFDLGAMS